MQQLIREFGIWLKQGFGWLVDVFVFACLWGISQVSRLLGADLGGTPILKILLLVLVLLLILYAFYWMFGRFIGVIRWALERIAYALGGVLLAAAVVSGVFASAGLVAAVAIWVLNNIDLAAR
jgi:low temperature requirement protein LtrA